MTEKTPTRLDFSQKHPFLFGLFLLTAAVVLMLGTMAAFRWWTSGESPLGGDRIGMVNVTGFIGDARDVVDWIRELREDEHVKGVIVRVNSPGGVIGPSQEIFEAVRKLAARKPVVASMGAVAASGGYYVAAPARAIMANPGTLTGSIGVKMQLTNVEQLMDKLGVGYEAVTSGKFKDAGAPYAKLTPEEREYLQSLVMEMYDQFVSDVAEARSLPRERVLALADGRAMTGRQAKDAGLVDALGGLEDAMALLKGMCGVKGQAPVMEGPRRERPWYLDLLLGALGISPAENVQGPRWTFLY